MDVCRSKVAVNYWDSGIILALRGHPPVPVVVLQPLTCLCLRARLLHVVGVQNLQSSPRGWVSLHHQRRRRETTVVISRTFSICQGGRSMTPSPSPRNGKVGTQRSSGPSCTSATPHWGWGWGGRGASPRNSLSLMYSNAPACQVSSPLSSVRLRVCPR